MSENIDPRRVRELFDAALALPPSDRDAFIERACETPELRAKVAALLNQHVQALESGFLERPAGSTDPMSEADTDPTLHPSAGHPRVAPSTAGLESSSSHGSTTRDHPAERASNPRRSHGPMGELPPPTNSATACSITITTPSGGSSSPSGNRPDHSTRASSPGSDQTALRVLSESLDDIPRISLADTERADPAPGPLVRHSDEVVANARPLAVRSLQLLGELARGGMGAVLRGHDSDLGRDVAVKVLLKKHADRPELVSRFVEEAQICGQLQHPGIVPLYDFGVFSDRRPYFTMKLVKGKTLASLLAERGTSSRKARGVSDSSSGVYRLAGQAGVAGGTDLASLLRIFEQMASTVGYAHSRGVIHRDLKPSNVMVGPYGEVLVMDWGLAKVLAHGGLGDDKASRKSEPSETIVATARSGDSSHPDLSRAGSVMGTPSYMPPEQANAEVSIIDRRTDVFALGSILCEILTGRPAYTGETSIQIQRKAQQAALDEALQAIQDITVDEDLKSIARACLNPVRADRPADAGEVASLVKAYFADVQDRLRATEIERAAQTARADEAEKTADEARARFTAERRAHQLRLAFAATIFVGLGLAAGGYGWLHARRTERLARLDRAVARALEETDRSANIAAASRPDLVEAWDQALSAADQALSLARQGEPEPAFLDRLSSRKRQLEQRRTESVEARKRLEADRELLATLETIRGNRAEHGDPIRTSLEYQRAFLQAGLPPDHAEPARFGQAIAERTSPLELVSYIDDWARVERSAGRPSSEWRALLSAARVADPDSWRDRLRMRLLNDDPALAEELTRLASDPTDLQRQPITSLVLLAEELAGRDDDHEQAERVLSLARSLDPSDFWVNILLAQVPGRESRSARVLFPEPEQSIPFLASAVALRPNSSMAHNNLGVALVSVGRFPEAVQEFQRAISLRPGDSTARCNLANALLERNSPAEAEQQSRIALQLAPNDPIALNNLGLSLLARDRASEAVDVFRRVAVLEPNRALARINLGKALNEQGDADVAISCFREAIQLEPKSLTAHLDLGNALRERQQLSQAAEILRRATTLAPDQAMPHVGLGWVLLDQRDYPAAEMEFRAAIKIDDHLALAYTGLGSSLAREADAAEMSGAPSEVCVSLHARAIESYLSAIRLDPAEARAHLGLGVEYLCLRSHTEAERALLEARRFDPSNADVHFNLGLVLERQGQPEAAADSYRKALDCDSDHLDALNNLGILLQRTGEWAEVISLFRRASLAEPGLAASHNNLAWALAVAPDPALRDTAGALAHSHRARELAPDDGNVLCTRALVEYRANQFEPARELLTRSRALWREVEPYADLIEAMILHGLGQPERAISSFEHGQRWITDNPPIEADLHVLWSECANLLSQPAPPPLVSSPGGG